LEAFLGVKEGSRTKMSNVKKMHKTKVAPKVPIKCDPRPLLHGEKVAQSWISLYNSSPGQTHFLKEVNK
jgi:hypothetical protein